MTPMAGSGWGFISLRDATASFLAMRTILAPFCRLEQDGRRLRREGRTVIGHLQVWGRCQLVRTTNGGCRPHGSRLRRVWSWNRKCPKCFLHHFDELSMVDATSTDKYHAVGGVVGLDI